MMKQQGARNPQRNARGSSRKNESKRSSAAKGARSVAKTARKTQNRGDTSFLGRAPAAMSRVRISNGRNPNNGNRTVIFEEYVQDIISSGTTLLFSATAFPVQVGISTLFAWLADQAINYQEYRFRRLSFRFETDQATSIAGKTMYAFSPDAADPTPVNKQEMLEYGTKAKSAVWQEFEMSIPLSEALGSKRFVRSGTLAANLDIKTYDFGVLFVATAGVVATSANVGELYVKYEVELITPVVQSLAAAQARSVRITAGGTVSASAVFGTVPVVLNGLNVTALSATLTFNKVGNYLLTMEVTGTGLNTAFVQPTGIQTNLVVTSIDGISNAAANAGTTAIFQVAIVVSARGATWNTGSWAAVATTVTATVTRISSYSEV